LYVIHKNGKFAVSCRKKNHAIKLVFAKKSGGELLTTHYYAKKYLLCSHSPEAENLTE
jgi:hypothetical protein